jgi:hypothetical protein
MTEYDHPIIQEFLKTSRDIPFKEILRLPETDALFTHFAEQNYPVDEQESQEEYFEIFFWEYVHNRLISILDMLNDLRTNSYQSEIEQHDQDAFIKHAEDHIRFILVSE